MELAKNQQNNFPATIEEQRKIMVPVGEYLLPLCPIAPLTETELKDISTLRDRVNENPKGWIEFFTAKYLTTYTRLNVPDAFRMVKSTHNEIEALQVCQDYFAPLAMNFAREFAMTRAWVFRWVWEYGIKNYSQLYPKANVASFPEPMLYEWCRKFAAEGERQFKIHFFGNPNPEQFQPAQLPAKVDTVQTLWNSWITLEGIARDMALVMPGPYKPMWDYIHKKLNDNYPTLLSSQTEKARFEWVKATATLMNADPMKLDELPSTEIEKKWESRFQSKDHLPSKKRYWFLALEEMAIQMPELIDDGGTNEA